MAPQHNDEEHSFSSEVDRLLPLNQGRLYPIESNRHHALRWLIFVTSAAVLTAISIVLSSDAHVKFKGHRHPKHKSSKQINLLTDLTTSKINTVTKKKSHWAKAQVTQQPTYNKTTICTTQLIIMRHCEKLTKKRVHGGKTKKRDTTDKLGNRHCSAKGKARSEYIATLFVDSNEIDAAIGTNDTSTNFNSPQKLYALSQVRYKHNEKDHKNYREVETLLPTATKFHLSVDDRFGVGDEGGLASDYFEILSRSVAEGVEGWNAMNATDSRDYCNNGMIVVNWKHSRIPKLSRALGCGKKQGCPKIYFSNDFDTVWLLTYQYSIEVRNGNGISRTDSSHRNYLKNLPFPAQGYWNVSAQLIKEGF